MNDTTNNTDASNANKKHTVRYGVTAKGKGYAHILRSDDRSALCKRSIQAYWKYDHLGPFTVCPRCVEIRKVLDCRDN